MSRSYRKIVADYHRQCPHHVALTNGGDWRSDYCSRAHYAVTGGALMGWSEGGRSVYGFQTAEQAVAPSSVGRIGNTRLLWPDRRRSDPL
jgi:hypothetical protein